MRSFTWFLINFLCLSGYFLFCTFFLWFLYYLKVLPSKNCVIRVKYNFLDFYLDFLKVSAMDFRDRDPETFKDTGIVIYEGKQGSGKTMSMVYDIYCLQKKYPKLKVLDNFGYDYSDLRLEDPSFLVDFRNDLGDKYGIVTALDECGILFNNREYKHFNENCNMLQVIFENRKVRRRLVGTSQKFSLIDKNLRLQVSEVRSAFTVGGCLSGYIRKVPQLDSDGLIKRYKFKGIKLFIQSPDLRSAYDTYYVIRSFKDKSYKEGGV